MKKWYLIAILVILVCLLLPSVFAEQEDIYVGLYVLGMDHYDLSTGSYNMNFYLDFKCNTSCDIQDFEMINGRGILDYWESTGADGRQYYRVNSLFVEKVDLGDYPFDTQALRIIIEDRSRPAGQVRFIPDLERSGIDERISFPGWIITGWTAYSSEHFYPAYGTTYSTYVFEISLMRPFEDALLMFLPICIIILVVLFTFFLGLNKLDLRIGIISSALIAAMMFHIAFASRLPPAVGYILLIDQFMMLTYFILLAFFVDTYILLWCMHKKRVSLANKIYAHTKYHLTIISLFLYVLLFVLFFKGIL